MNNYEVSDGSTNILGPDREQIKGADKFEMSIGKFEDSDEKVIVIKMLDKKGRGKFFCLGIDSAIEVMEHFQELISELAEDKEIS